MTRQRHTIKKQILELQVSSDMQSVALQSQIIALYRSQIIPLIEAYCDRLSQPDQLYRIDRLEIDLGEINLATLEIDFVQKVAESLWAQLSQRLTTSSPHSVSQPTSPLRYFDTDLELFRDLIQKGRLPWWCETLERTALENRFAQLSIQFPEKLKTLMQSSLKQERTLQRILYQFSEVMLMDTVRLLVPNWHSILCDYLADIQALIPQTDCLRNCDQSQLQQIIWWGILNQISLNPNSKPNDDDILIKNLWHLAHQLQANSRSLFQQLLTATATLSTKGISLASPLPTILLKLLTKTTSISATNPATNPDQKLIELIDLAIAQLTYLQSLDLDLPMSSPLNLKINALLQQHRAISSSLNPFSDFLPTIAALITTLIAELEQQETPSILQPILPQLRAIIRAINSAIVNRTIPPLKLSPVRPLQKLDPFRKEDEDIYIQNAGLILIWPFLPRFFETLGWVQLEQFVTPQATYKAILLLQYLVDGSTEALESLLPLNKLLCAVNIEDPVPASLPLAKNEQDEADQLLRAVVHNWSALKSLSINGLRRAFLQRSGVLRLQGDRYLLQVEHQTHDILIDKLPWSIRVVKLPWMDRILYVEW